MDFRVQFHNGPAMTRNIKLTIAYDGTDFSGWQVQPGLRTVQGMLAKAVTCVTREEVLAHGSGRTDAGVHALGQVAGFFTSSPIPAPNLVIALNDSLPLSIRVLSAEEVAEDFHPRKSAKAKTYRYRICRAAICSPFEVRFVYHHPWPLDEEAMKAAASSVLGQHDFTSFAASDPDRLQRIAANAEDDDEAPSNIRTIFRSELRREGHELIYEVRGNGFLHHMVRNLVGLFLLVGKGTVTVPQIKEILAARNRSVNPGATAPASGLALVSVEY